MTATIPDRDQDTVLSVVIVSFNQETLLRRCLQALVAQVTDEVALLVVRRGPPEAALLADFPQVRWLEAADTATVPLLRAQGIASSNGRLVALLEDDCVVCPDWCKAHITAHSTTAHPAVGGPILPDAYQTGLNWAVFLCEYGRFLPPLVGEVPYLAGNNVSYKRTALAGDDWQQGFYETFLHQQWQAAGRKLWAVTQAAVVQINRWRWPHVSGIPYHHGRTFAAMRLAKRPFWQRGLYALLTKGLPALQLIRMIGFVRRKAGARPPLDTWFWVLIFYSSWSLGEWTGALFGAGNSAAQWR